MIDDSIPVPVVAADHLIPVTDTPRRMLEIPASRMFLINKSLSVFRQAHTGEETFDASQGDGGASLPGVPVEILDRAHAMQKEHGSAYDMPYGTDAYRRSVVEQYWRLEAASGLGPANVLAAVGGRDALVKAYAAMIALGHGRAGDFVLVSRVPWISYNWGPYGVGANVLLAPGTAEQGWAFTEEGLQASVDYAGAGWAQDRRPDPHQPRQSHGELALGRPAGGAGATRLAPGRCLSCSSIGCTTT